MLTVPISALAPCNDCHFLLGPGLAAGCETPDL